jgi:hypothetical protein
LNEEVEAVLTRHGFIRFDVLGTDPVVTVSLHPGHERPSGRRVELALMSNRLLDAGFLVRSGERPLELTVRRRNA